MSGPFTEIIITLVVLLISFRTVCIAVAIVTRRSTADIASAMILFPFRPFLKIMALRRRARLNATKAFEAKSVQEFQRLMDEEQARQSKTFVDEERERALREEELQKREEEERIRREHEEFLRRERHHRCSRDSFRFPVSLMPICPKCKCPDVEQVEAGSVDTSVSARKIAPDRFKELYNEKVDQRDFIGLSNTLLESLMRPNQHKEPDEITSYLADVIPGIVAEKFDIPTSMTYARPHADWYLPPHLRGDWTADDFHQLCIFAYVLGATWKVLPTPHFGLIDYYHWMAVQQEQMIEDARDKAGSSARRFRLSDL